MKVKVIESFKDKYTNEIYPVDKELDITEERFAEILETGAFVEKIEEPEKKPAKKKTAKKKAE